MPAAKAKAPIRKPVARIAATTMRFPPEIKEALDKAAKLDRRTSTSLAMKILEDWLKEHGHM